MFQILFRFDFLLSNEVTVAFFEKNVQSIDNSLYLLYNIINMKLSLFESIFLLLCGSGVFLTGMRLMSDGLEKSAGQGLRGLFNRIGNRNFATYFLGVGTTMVIQSSDAAVVMTMGLANAGIVTLIQAASIALGARLGTTITGILVSLSSFNVTPILMAFALVGIVLIMFVKNNNTVNSVGYVLTGFGVLFSGLYLMSYAIKNNEQITGAFINLFSAIDFPLLLFLVGILFTAMIQSSSAVVGIVIVMINAGTLTLGQAMFLIIGATVGTTLMPLIASFKGNIVGRRIAFIYAFTGLVGAIIVGGLTWIFKGPIVDAFSHINSAAWQASLFDVVYSALASLLMFAFLKPIVKLSETLIKDKKSEATLSLYYISDNLLVTPALALPQVRKEVSHLGDLAISNLKRGFNAMLDLNFEKKERILAAEQEIDFLTKEISKFLVKLSGKPLDLKDTTFVATLHHVLDDIERIGDHGEDFLKQGLKMQKEGVEFSSKAKGELMGMINSVMDMSTFAMTVFNTGDATLLPVVTEKEEIIDKEKRQLSSMHVQRLNQQECSVEASSYFYTAIASLERVGDHLENVAYSVVSITGDTD